MEVEPIGVPHCLMVRANEITANRVGDQGFRYLPESWAKKLGSADVLALNEQFGGESITREMLFALGDVARRGDSSECRRLLLATLMWGYGTRGGRSYRNAQAVLADRRLDGRLAQTMVALEHADLIDAYKALRGLAGYDEGFFTKYLYFATHGSRWSDDQPRPLIFDSTVRTTLGFIAKVLASDWQLGAPPRWAPAKRYRHYCGTLARWADDLTQSGFRCTADQVELFLYSPGKLIFTTAEPLRMLTEAALADIALGSAGPRVRSSVQALSADLIASLEDTTQTPCVGGK
jgi:hypothetical protein